MVSVSYPGVYIREVPSGVNSISGVSTSIAVFIGMCKRGPLMQPRRVLGFTDYSRIFSDDTSQGEMTEQVRQFFTNGGEQAYIMRVALNAMPAAVTLANEAGANVLTLNSKDAGLDANQLRAKIDYNTASPELTFNIELFREVFDASGQPVISDSEPHADLSMNPESPRYVQTVLDQQSVLASATVDALAVAAAATLPGFSASATIHADAAAADAALVAALAALPAGANGQFRIKVGSAPWLTIDIDRTATTLSEVETAINLALAAHTTVDVAITAAADAPFRITASAAGNDVTIAPGTQNDISLALGLGLDQGGLEVGSYSAARPAPSGLVSVLDDGSGDLQALLNLGTAPKNTFDSPGIAGVAAFRPFTTPLASIAYPDAAGTLAQGTRSTGNSLRNVNENLQAIATAMSNESPDWQATVHGHRLVLTPTFGSTAVGSGAVFTSASPDLTTADQIFENITARSGAYSLGAGSDGSLAQLDNYRAAFNILDEEIDLFNLMILPRSAGDSLIPPTVRGSVWGEASSFCQRRRSFLIADVEPTVQTPDGVLDAIPDFRVGIVKDHTGFWWPRLTITTSDGNSKQIDPSGSVAGLMSRIDGTRGVWKAPAGLEAGILGVRGVEVPMSDPQNGVLNPQACNAIRAFPNGVISWGSRTMDGFDNSGNTDYRYVPVRRFALFIEESLRRGMQFAVFEPNDEPLWAQIRLSAGSFMNGLFRKGAFAGQSASDAYFIKADAETTTPTDQNLGVVNVLVGFAPLKPAEFIVISLQQKAGQVQV